MSKLTIASEKVKKKIQVRMGIDREWFASRDYYTYSYSFLRDPALRSSQHSFGRCRSSSTRRRALGWTAGSSFIENCTTLRYSEVRSSLPRVYVPYFHYYSFSLIDFHDFYLRAVDKANPRATRNPIRYSAARRGGGFLKSKVSKVLGSSFTGCDSPIRK